MKEMVIDALKAAYVLMESQVPKTKPSVNRIYLDKLTLLEFMNKVNKMKDTDDESFHPTARFETFETGGILRPVLAWDVTIPTTENDKNLFRHDRFSDIAWQMVYSVFIKNGYTRSRYIHKRNSSNSDAAIYDAYMNGEFDRLFDYYNVLFKPID